MVEASLGCAQLFASNEEPTCEKFSVGNAGPKQVEDLKGMRNSVCAMSGAERTNPGRERLLGIINGPGWEEFGTASPEPIRGSNLNSRANPRYTKLSTTKKTSACDRPKADIDDLN